MKKMKKFASVLLALVMALALAMPALAASGNKASITLPEDSILDGHEFTAYQIFSGTQTDDQTNELADVEWGSGIDSEAFLNALATSTDLQNEKGEQIFNADMSAAGVADALAGVTTAQANTVAQLAYDNKTGTGTELSAGANSIERGYYLIVDTTDDVGENGAYNAALLQVTNNVTVQVKTDVPSLDKTIVENEEDVKYNNGAIGDTVTFKLTSAVPQNMDQYEKYFFVVNDTLSKGLTLADNFTLTSVTLGNKTLTADTDYTLTTTNNKDDTTSIEIVFKNFIQYAAQAGDAIVITYDAVIDTDAVIGVEGNPNAANLIYSNNPNEQGNGDPNDEDKPGPEDPTGKTPDSTTYTYVTEIQLNKVDQDGNPLVGAQFSISNAEGSDPTLNTVIVGNTFKEDANGTYWLLKDGHYTTTDPNDENINQDMYADTVTKYALVETTIIEKNPAGNTNYSAWVDENGVVRFTGLSEGKYIIKEVTTPNGYNTIASDIEVTIGWAAPDEDSTDCTWSVTATNQKDADDPDSVQGMWTVTDAGTFVLSVVNNSGSTLPETGGIGTTIFYVVGGVLVVGAAVLLITKKRMGSD